MIISLKRPDWDTECEGIHDFMQELLTYVEQTASFDLHAFDTTDARKAFIGLQKKKSDTRKKLEGACGAIEKSAFRQAHAKDREYNKLQKGFRFAHHQRGQAC